MLFPETRRVGKVGVHGVSSHRPIIVLQGPAGAVVLPLDRQEVTFRVSREGEASPRLVFAEPPAYPPGRAFRNVIELEQIAPKRARVNPLAMEDANSMGLISARVVIDDGLMASESYADAMPLFVPDSEQPRFSKETSLFAFQASLSLGEVSGVEVLVRSLDEASAPRVLLAALGREVTINIGNICSDDLACLIDGTRPRFALETDDDFAAIYSVTAGAVGELERLPVPSTNKPGQGGGARCHSAILLP